MSKRPSHVELVGLIRQKLRAVEASQKESFSTPAFKRLRGFLSDNALLASLAELVDRETQIVLPWKLSTDATWIRARAVAATRQLALAERSLQKVVDGLRAIDLGVFGARKHANKVAEMLAGMSALYQHLDSYGEDSFFRDEGISKRRGRARDAFVGEVLRVLAGTAPVRRPQYWSAEACVCSELCDVVNEIFDGAKYELPSFEDDRRKCLGRAARYANPALARGGRRGRPAKTSA